MPGFPSRTRWAPAALLALPLLGTACEMVDGGSGRRIPLVRERWVSAWSLASNLDSPALWRGPEEAWVVSTAKGTHDLWVHDAADGALLKRVGRRGNGPGEFGYPNGIAVRGDLLLVVERDNRRVQLLSLPGFEPLGWFGGEELVRPYGLTLFARDDSTLVVYVTDDYGNEAYIPGFPLPAMDLSRRVKEYELRLGPDGVPEAYFVRAFGEAEGPGALHVVESIQVDEERGVVLVADERTRELELYSLEGAYLERTVGAGLFRYGEPEGVALYRCGSDGYWILTEQRETRSVFHVLERMTFRLVGSFVGRVTANTDGIWLDQEGIPGLGRGVLFASHADGAVAAFAWEDIAAALGLTSTSEACPAPPGS